MSDAAKWLRAQLVKRMSLSQAATGRQWRWSRSPIFKGSKIVLVDETNDIVLPILGERLSAADANFIEANAPSWALAVTNRDLAIFDHHGPRQLPTAPIPYCVCDVCDVGPPPKRHVPWPCLTVKLLAVPFAGLADFPDILRPEGNQ